MVGHEIMANPRYLENVSIGELFEFFFTNDNVSDF